VRHGTCFRHRLSTHHAGAAPHSAVAELEVVRRRYAHTMKIDQITEVIAADDWSYATSSGETVFARIEIGRPEPAPDDPNGDWFCPISIEGFTSQITSAYGVGPVDALNNALTLVRAFASKIGEYTPRASEDRKAQS